MIVTLTLILAIIYLKISSSKKFSDKTMKRTRDSLLKWRLEEMEARFEVFAHNPKYYEDIYLKSNPQDISDIEMDRQVRAGVYEPALLEIIYTEEFKRRVDA